MWIRILILIIINLTINNSAFNYCQIGATGKCLGDTMKMTDVGTPSQDAGDIVTYITDYNTCTNHCIWNYDCYMASYNIYSNVCNLYKYIIFEHSTSPITKLFLWYCCNSSNNAPNRCPGFWKYQPKAQSDNAIRPLDPLKEVAQISLFNCQFECLKNSICGAINYFPTDSDNSNYGLCQLIIQFPVEDLNILTTDIWSTYQWQCANDYTPPEPSKECIERDGYTFGHWVIENESISFNFNKKQLIYFYTLDFNQCLNNCAFYSQCKTAWYSYNSFLCILEALETSDCADTTPKNNYNFTTYVWKDCFQYQTISNYKTTSCKRLINNEHVYINPIECGKYPSDLSNLYKCWKDPESNHGLIFSNNLHCQENQSFRIFDKFKPSSSNFKEFADYQWLRAYTGYDTFWLVNVSNVNLIPTTNEECNIFDANMDVTNSNPLTIVNHKDWFPSKPTDKENPFPNHPVKFVIISDTEVPFCNCFSIEACSSIMRRIQLALQPNIFSIPYSFVITGDGIAYEARGWQLEPALAGGEYNSNSFVIALCGQYKNNPNLASILSVKKLIRMAVNFKKVSKNYTLYIYNDVRNRPYPYNGLRRVFELWPHYRGYVKHNCYRITKACLIFNILAIVICIFLLALFISMFYVKVWHKKSCFLLKEFRIEVMYGNILKTTKEILPQILFHPMSKLQSEEIFISPITSTLFWIEDFPLFDEKQNDCKCKAMIFSILDINRRQCNLVNIGSFLLLKDFCCCTRIIVFVFQRNAELSLECFLILHLRHRNSFNRFLFKLYQNKCICDCFTITKYVYDSEYLMTCKYLNKGKEHMPLKQVSSRKSIEKLYTFYNEENCKISYDY